MAEGYAVNVKGIAELRRTFRATDRLALAEIRDTLKHGAEIGAEQASRLAPRRTGRLAESYRAYTRGNRAGIRSPLPYAGVVEYGGTIHPRGVDITFRRSLPVTRAVERQLDTIVSEVGVGIERAALNAGWRR